MSSCRFCRVIFRLELPMCSRAKPPSPGRMKTGCNSEAIDLLDLIVLRNETGISGEAAVEVDARALSALHPALAVRVARIAMETVAPGRFRGIRSRRASARACAGPARGRGPLSLPGQHAVRRGETLCSMLSGLSGPARRRPAIRELFSRFAVYSRRGRPRRHRAGQFLPLSVPDVADPAGTLNRDSHRGHSRLSVPAWNRQWRRTG